MNHKTALEIIRDPLNYSSQKFTEAYNFISEELERLAVYESSMKNLHTVSVVCDPFCTVVQGLKKEQKYAIYENNYYTLQEVLNDIYLLTKENIELRAKIRQLEKDVNFAKEHLGEQLDRFKELL